MQKCFLDETSPCCRSLKLPSKLRVDISSAMHILDYTQLYYLSLKETSLLTTKRQYKLIRYHNKYQISLYCLFYYSYILYYLNYSSLSLSTAPTILHFIVYCSFFCFFILLLLKSYYHYCNFLSIKFLYFIILLLLYQLYIKIFKIIFQHFLF